MDNYPIKLVYSPFLPNRHFFTANLDILISSTWSAFSEPRGSLSCRYTLPCWVDPKGAALAYFKSRVVFDFIICPVGGSYVHLYIPLWIERQLPKVSSRYYTFTSSASRRFPAQSP
ncbi:hypothetical protein BDV23DRAFT_145058 [Aspergillus alliaceus]|uniref:Uncharacterized protein n=1 Tax=Petromyces alliaceus TaxID=209559 RepID=A0A5N7CMM2_PETAA|nr:hypothetical protein BDV23DRAFT_145058 [Aspergillus alliaceus]